MSLDEFMQADTGQALEPSTKQISHGLKNQHLQLIGIGGAIGARFSSGLRGCNQPGRPSAVDCLCTDGSDHVSDDAGAWREATKLLPAIIKNRSPRALHWSMEGLSWGRIKAN